MAFVKTRYEHVVLSIAVSLALSVLTVRRDEVKVHYLMLKLNGNGGLIHGVSVHSSSSASGVPNSTLDYN